MKTNMTFSLNIDKTKEISKALDSQIKEALEDCGQTAHRYAFLGCPVDTGRLRNSIAYSVYKNQGGIHKYQDDGLEKGQPSGNEPKEYEYEYGPVGEEKSMYLGTNVEYAPYVEEGSNGRDPSHFIKHAIENHKEEYRKIIDDHLRGKI